MKFQPTAFMGGEPLLEPCCELGTANSTQVYPIINGVQWQVNLYTSSIQLGGATGSSETHQVPVTGSTTHAIVACVGGGGSAYSKQQTDGYGFGGGGGGVIVSSSITLTSGSVYSVTIGNGGDGFSCVPETDACNPNGMDGNFSSFVGQGYDIVAEGGKGSTLADGSGGSSGSPNIHSGSAAGGSGAAFAATGSDGAYGLSFFVGQSAPIFRAGGGGGTGAFGTDDAKPWGGDSTVYTREEGQAAWTFGGGANGKLEYHSDDDQYYSKPAASGCVVVAVPMNLCSSSLYQKTDYVKSDLLNYWDFSNGRTFGKEPYDSVLTDIRTSTNKLYAQGTGSVVTNPSGSTALLLQNYLGDVPLAYITGSEPSSSRVIAYDEQKISGSLFTVASEFSYEWYGRPDSNPETLFSVSKFSENNPNANPKIILTETGGGRLDYVAPGGAETQLSSPLVSNADNHVVLTYDGTDLKVYVDGVLEDTGTVSVSSELDNPMFFLGDAPNPSGDSNSHYLFRAYNDELTSDEVIQNYSASAAL